jgi:hypothetical protein
MQAAEAALGDSFSPWSSKKSGILSKYTTSVKLAIGVVRTAPPPYANWHRRCSLVRMTVCTELYEQPGPT